MGGQEVDIGRRKGEPRVAGTGRYKGENVRWQRMLFCDEVGGVSSNMMYTGQSSEQTVSANRIVKRAQ